MKKNVIQFRINRVEHKPNKAVIHGNRNQKVEVPRSLFDGLYPENIVLGIICINARVTYIYGTNIVTSVQIADKILFTRSDDEFPEWQKFFAGKTDEEIDIALSIREYNDNADILRDNIANSCLDVFRIRAEILLKHYQDEVPDLVQRLKIEDGIISVVKHYINWNISPLDIPKHEIVSLIKTCVLVPFDSFADWCVKEVKVLHRKYMDDKRKERKIGSYRLKESEVLKHQSQLIPIGISSKKIEEYQQAFLQA